MTTTKLSKHFTLKEALHTDKAQFLDRNILEGEKHWKNLLWQAHEILEPVREHINQPLTVESWFRCWDLNSFVGGVATSQHLQGLATDFYCPQIPNEDIFLYLQDFFKGRNFMFGQLILEPNWIHLSAGVPFRELERCRQILRRP